MADEAVADEVDALPASRRASGISSRQRVALGLAQVDRDHPPARRVEVGLEEEQRAVVADEAVLRVEVGRAARRPGALRLAEVLVEDARSCGVGALPDGDDQVPAVVGDVGAEAPLLLVGALVDEQVVGLRRAEAVVAELLVLVATAVSVARRRRLVVAAVEEALAVVRSTTRRENLTHSSSSARSSPVVDVAHPPLLPVGARARRGRRRAACRRR